MSEALAKLEPEARLVDIPADTSAGEAQKLLAELDNAINTLDDFDVALNIAQAKIKVLEALREIRTRSLLDALELERQPFRIPMALWEQCKAKAKEGYKAKRQEELDKVAEALRKGEELLELPKTSGVRRGTVRKFRIVDASKVPAAYRSIDERLIEIDVSKGVREIPGVEIYEETTIASKGRR